MSISLEKDEAEDAAFDAASSCNDEPDVSAQVERFRAFTGS
jgi:hypothetical protein